MNAYKNLIRPVLFKLEAERAHDLAIQIASRSGELSFLGSALSAYTTVRDNRLVHEVAGIRFENPIGLAAGYDKSGRAVDGLTTLGFGHIEVGSVSLNPSAGNPKPRLFRLPEDKAVIVHYGLQNEGSRVVTDRLLRRNTPVPVGINIVKTNRGIDAPAESAEDIIDEYVSAVKIVQDSCDYLTLNLSCPNTEDGRDFFADAHHTSNLMSAFSDIRIHCPMFLKVSPMGGDAAIEGLLEAVDGFGFVSGFVFNLAPGVHADLKTPRDQWDGLPGALAGKPVKAQMNQKIRGLYSRMDSERYRIIGAGGVATAEEAYEKIKLGASLVQLLTALVYEGPGVVKRINQGLCELMEQDGVKTVAEVVGVDVKKG
ncbi:MAG: quinone-dependent dihydroorotate dehydrogenase [Candidatus Latescibacterota bacterium]|nr:quinone-dependent dihydroorotate dehydrogenase [Candidatus Latescibacterota bacterium]